MRPYRQYYTKFPGGSGHVLRIWQRQCSFQVSYDRGTPKSDAKPDFLILDGQQRLTSIYSSLCSSRAVKTKTDKGNPITRFYYIDIPKAVDSSVDRMDAIISVPENKQMTSDFGRKIDLDVSTAEKEYENKLFPLNIILDSVKATQWQIGYMQYYQADPSVCQEYLTFMSEIIQTVSHYQIPVITLDKETPKEAVCQVFENVNQGGVSLTVFELVTVVFAMDDFELRPDWENRKYKKMGVC